MTKRKAETKEEGKSKQVKTEEEEVFDATLGEITEITDMPVMGEGLILLIFQYPLTNLLSRKMEE